MKEMTPREVVRELDRYIIGQDEAKRNVAIALRNRYRRSKVDAAMREEISPKNILMVGPTGVGKTEIARRLARLMDAPFVKVEATKFTEVGYVGRDVDSIIRDLAENAYRIVKKEHEQRVRVRAEVLAEDRLATLIAEGVKAKNNSDIMAQLTSFLKPEAPQPQQDNEQLRLKKNEVKEKLRSGELENQEIDVEVEDAPAPIEVGGNAIAIGDMMGGMMPKRTKIRRMKVKEARKVLVEEEAAKLIDDDAVKEEAVKRAEEHGIVFIDEMDKICGRANGSSAEVSREGVQRDILPIVEGSIVNTKYGAVRTDFILFIAAGAFHVAKVSDLIPELQGRFPVRVTLNSLSKEDFVKILTQTDNALTRQYQALLAVDKVHLTFEKEALDAIAEAAFEANATLEDIGARRLHGIFEELLEDISFHAGDENMPDIDLNITAAYVDEHLQTVRQRDFKRFIL